MIIERYTPAMAFIPTGAGAAHKRNHSWRLVVIVSIGPEFITVLRMDTLQAQKLPRSDEKYFREPIGVTPRRILAAIRRRRKAFQTCTYVDAKGKLKRGRRFSKATVKEVNAALSQ